MPSKNVKGCAFSMLRLRQLCRLQPQRLYSSHLDPATKGDYQAFVDHWTHHFSAVDEDFELERGLNHIFAADWVPSVELVAEALKASRRLNSFATAVRVLEALEEKAYKKDQYTQYIAHLSPLLKELGVPEKKQLGGFAVYRDRNPWTE